jgi:hypothetical protein
LERTRGAFNLGNTSLTKQAMAYSQQKKQQLAHNKFAPRFQYLVGNSRGFPLSNGFILLAFWIGYANKRTVWKEDNNGICVRRYKVSTSCSVYIILYGVVIVEIAGVGRVQISDHVTVQLLGSGRHAFHCCSLEERGSFGISDVTAPSRGAQ